MALRQNKPCVAPYISDYIFCHSHLSLNITILKGSLFIRCPIEQLLKVRHFPAIALYALTTIKTVLSYSKKYSTAGDYNKKQVEENVQLAHYITHQHVISV